MTETCHLLSRRVGNYAQTKFIESFLAGAFHIQPPDGRDLSRLHALLVKYEDLPIDLADASLVLLAEHLGHGRILSTDNRDFNAYRWKHRHPFENLLLS